MTKTRKNTAKLVSVCSIVLITAFSSIALADSGGFGGDYSGRNHHQNFRKIATKLGLTDAQKAQAKAIFEANKPLVKPLYESLQTERTNLQALIHADSVNEDAIRAESAKIAGIQADLNVNRAKTGVQFRAILTPEQLATLKTLKEKRGQRHSKTAPNDL